MHKEFAKYLCLALQNIQRFPTRCPYRLDSTGRERAKKLIYLYKCKGSRRHDLGKVTFLCKVHALEIAGGNTVNRLKYPKMITVHL